ncbi:hypothetical protein M8C21_002196 [Ambrosia artemisiifolia]|uniref:Uncharacterized protein n=1 Tax=Ambrosia artemisiifolia TaxID=4212 RepID=A0AAD5BTD0_AMBAR|nr:hypothetical protein M8C21_002196 [Ambrosia artemisiifolia]
MGGVCGRVTVVLRWRHKVVLGVMSSGVGCGRRLCWVWRMVDGQLDEEDDGGC